MYLSKLETCQTVKVKKFTDIKLNESYNKKNKKTISFTSLEEWAILILKPPVWKRLDKAIEADHETEERWNRCKQKVNDGYQFMFTSKNYANKKKQKAQDDEPTVQPRFDYSNKTINELQSVINKGLLYGQMNANKLEKKPKPTKDDKKMIDTM